MVQVLLYKAALNVPDGSILKLTQVTGAACFLVTVTMGAQLLAGFCWRPQQTPRAA